MKTDVTRRAGTHCPCCHDRVHPTDLECRHCGADLAAGSHPSAKPNPLAGLHDEDTPHGFWPAMSVALVLMTVAFFVFPPAALVMLAAAGAYQVARMHVREAT